VPAGTNSFTVTIRAADEAGHTNQASRTWTVDPSGDTVAPQMSSFNITTNMLLPDAAEVWIEGVVNETNALVSAIVNSGSGITTNLLNMRAQRAEGLVSLEFGTNQVVLVASDAAGNKSSNVFTLIRADRFYVAITNPVFGAFATATSSTVRGYVSAKFDAGLPTETNITTVTINGVTAVLGTNVDGNGNVSFTTPNEISLGEPITGTIGGPGIPTDPAPSLPPAQSQEYEVTYKETGAESIASGEGAGFNLQWNVLSNCWLGVLTRAVTTQRQILGVTSIQVQTARENDRSDCQTVLNPDQMAWQLTSTNSSSNSSSTPIDRSLKFGLFYYVHGAGRDRAVVLDTYDPGTGQCTFHSESHELRALGRERDTGWLKFRAPRHYDTNTTVILTFEGVSYAGSTGLYPDLAQVKFRGQDPFTYSNEVGSVSYLVTVDGGREYAIGPDDFQWPASSQPGSYAEAFTDPNACPLLNSHWRAGNYITDYHWLSWGNSHNAKPEIDIVGLDPSRKRDPGGLVVCNCDSNSPPRGQIVIQKLTNVNVNTVLTIPSQLRVFTAWTNGAEVTSGSAFSNARLPTNLWVEGKSASTNMRDAQLTVAVEGATNSSDYVMFTVLWVDLSSRTNGQASLDNAARGNYWAAEGGTFDLGPLNNGVQMVCGIEFTGSVHPSEFNSTIALRRSFNSARTYLGSSQDTSSGSVNNDGGVDDTSASDYVDQDPQSDNSHGRVYDLDAPGLALRQSLPVGSIRRNRFNFKEWTEYSGARCSAYI